MIDDKQPHPGYFINLALHKFSQTYMGIRKNAEIENFNRGYHEFLTSCTSLMKNPEEVEEALITMMEDDLFYSRDDTANLIKIKMAILKDPKIISVRTQIEAGVVT